MCYEGWFNTTGGLLAFVGLDMLGIYVMDFMGVGEEKMPNSLDVKWFPFKIKLLLFFYITL